MPIVMTTRTTTIRPYRIAALHVAGLVTFIAGMAFAPFSKVLLGLMMMWVGLTFVFSLAVFAVTCLLFALAFVRFVVGGIRRVKQGVGGGKPSATKPGGVGTAGT